MQHPFVVWIATLLGLTQCEGVVLDDFATDSGAKLVGTWMEVRTTYSTTLTGQEWVSTQRKTIIVDQLDGKTRFRDCIDGSIVTAKVRGKRVTLSGGDYPVLILDNADTLASASAKANTDASVTDTTESTEVTLYRESEISIPLVASLSLIEPYTLDDWTQLCLDTEVTAAGQDQLSFKAVNSVLGVETGMTFNFSAPVAAGVYTFLAFDGLSEVTGTFSDGVDAGPLTGQSGTVTVSDNDTLDFQVDLEMISSLDDETYLFNGLLEIDPKWFEQE